MAAQDPVLTPALFRRFRELLYKKTGIHLAEHKVYLVEGRLSHFVGEGKSYSTYADFESALAADLSGQLSEEFVNVMTTNFSYFFRDPVHFQTLAWYVKERGPSSSALRFWSAASSTGEEAYSMAMTLLLHREFLPGDCRILATDISTRVLAKAEAGVYSSSQILPYAPPQTRQWFDQESDGRLRVKSEVKNMVSFRHWNLKDHFPFTRPMDVVFLRNVLIYFDNAVTEDVVRRIEQILRPGGLLILGLSESLVGIRHPLRMLKNSIYQKTRHP